MTPEKQIYIFHTIDEPRDSRDIKSGKFRTIHGLDADIKKYVKTHTAEKMENLDCWIKIIKELDDGRVVYTTFIPPDKKRRPPFFKGTNQDIINADYIPVIEYSMPKDEYQRLNGKPPTYTQKVQRDTPKEQKRQSQEKTLNKKVQIFESIFEVVK